MSACTIDFCNREYFHRVMKADLRISIKDYPRNKNLKILLFRAPFACRQFLVDWYARNVELINQYQPDLLWFDNGIDQRYLDPLKAKLKRHRWQ